MFFTLYIFFSLYIDLYCQSIFQLIENKLYSDKIGIYRLVTENQINVKINKNRFMFISIKLIKILRNIMQWNIR